MDRPLKAVPDKLFHNIHWQYDKVVCSQFIQITNTSNTQSLKKTKDKHTYSIYWSKITDYFVPPLGVTSLEFRRDFGIKKPESLDYRTVLFAWSSVKQC